MDRDQQGPRERNIARWMLRCHQWDSLALYVPLHLLCFVKAERLSPVVDEHVEMREEVLPQKPADARIGGLHLSEVVDDYERLVDDVGACFQCVQHGHGSPGIIANRGHADGGFGLQIEFRCQRRLDDRQLAVRIHDEVIRSGVIDTDRNNN